jgi:hypothetical protein
VENISNIQNPKRKELKLFSFYGPQSVRDVARGTTILLDLNAAAHLEMLFKNKDLGPFEESTKELFGLIEEKKLEVDVSSALMERCSTANLKTKNTPNVAFGDFHSAWLDWFRACGHHSSLSYSGSCLKSLFSNQVSMLQHSFFEIFLKVRNGLMLASVDNKELPWNAKLEIFKRYCTRRNLQLRDVTFYLVASAFCEGPSARAILKSKKKKDLDGRAWNASWDIMLHLSFMGLTIPTSRRSMTLCTDDGGLGEFIHRLSVDSTTITDEVNFVANYNFKIFQGNDEQNSLYDFPILKDEASKQKFQQLCGLVG